MPSPAAIEKFINDWQATGGSELANTQSFINGLCALIDVEPPYGSRSDDIYNDYVFERRVFQKEADNTESFGRIDAYKRDCFVLEAKQGSDADRKATDRGDKDYDIFGQTAAARLKRGTALRGTPAWSKAMVEARGQAERYAKALPLTHGWPPFLLITDVGHCIDVYADFSGSGKQYVQFPDSSRFRIKLEDLRQEAVLSRLAAIWTDPLSLNPATEAAKVTREIADQLAALSKRLEARLPDPTRVADFLMRCLFTMFAEDVGLIPEKSFTQLLRKFRVRPKNLNHALADLWQKMDEGGFVGSLGDAGEVVRKFNGYLFKDRGIIDLDTGDLDLLIKASEKKWNHVEPAIFGTLLERALDPKERAKFGAHYTPRAYVERLIVPTIMEPLRATWAGVRGAVASLIEAGKATEAKTAVENFHSVLAQTRVLDPACGTGNFLYVAMARMKELEGEVIALLVELGEKQYVAELSGHTITPENFLGIEINPRAAAIAQLVLWIGYLQWHFKVNGEGRMPPEPILRDVRTIENRDALIAWDAVVPEVDGSGNPLTRWDGVTMTIDHITGQSVPDGSARVQITRFISPRPAAWPAADYIIGNPPFVSSRETRELLGDGYAKALRAAYPKIPGNVDLVMYFWNKAAQHVRNGSKRFGLITTSRIRMEQNREVVSQALGNDLTIEFAIPDHPWAGKDAEAGVRVAFTTIMKAGRQRKRLCLSPDHDDASRRVSDGTVLEDSHLREFHRPKISHDLSPSVSIDSVKELKAWSKIAHAGMKPYAKTLLITDETAKKLFPDLRSRKVRAPNYLNGQDIARQSRGVRVLDFNDCDTEAQVRIVSQSAYQYLLNHTKPERSQERNSRLQREWWKFEATRDVLRTGIASLKRYVATVENSANRYFVFVDAAIMPDQKLRCFALDDAYCLGVLSSRYHSIFADRLGGRNGVGNTPVYNTKCATTFPFPHGAFEPVEDGSKPVGVLIREEAEALDQLRKQVIASHTDITLTKLYYLLAVIRDGKRVLTDAERDIHDRGLLTIVQQHHDAIDILVAKAYGWSASWTKDEILTQLVALNEERQAEEAAGLVRWLRPDFQDPGETVAGANRRLDLADVSVAAVAKKHGQWPKSLADQLSAVAAVFVSSPGPLKAQEVAQHFEAKRAASMIPVLDALAAIGQIRRLSDKRYAA